MTKSSTTRGQRIGIWIIAALMALGTVGSLLVVLLANDNSGKDQARLQKMIDDYDKVVSAHNNKLSEKYFDTFKAYTNRIGEFDGNITELQKEDLKVGDGEEITEEDLSDNAPWAYYIGWLPDGTVFDSSFDAEPSDISNATKLNGPIEIEKNGVIKGWTEGVVGMKTGGVRELTIPSSLAYGEQGSGEIPANSTIRFVVFVIDNPDQPDYPAELLKLYERVYGAS